MRIHPIRCPSLKYRVQSLYSSGHAVHFRPFHYISTLILPAQQFFQKKKLLVFMKKIRLFAFCAFAFFSCAALCSALPKGYGSIELGMSVDEVKSELKKNTDFGYRGDKDVSLSPKTKQVLIETDASKNAYSFFTRCWFQFVDDKLFSITLNLN